MSDELRDQLPDDLNAVDFAGAYEFPDNSRRRIPAAIYGVLAAAVAVAWMTADRDTSVIVNDGALLGAVILGAAAVISFTSGWRMSIDEREALVRATASVGFVVGHASAQQVWRGVRSRPTWRIFCYSAEEPPLQRGLVLVDAVDGKVMEVLVEENPDLASPVPGDQVKYSVPPMFDGSFRAPIERLVRPVGMLLRRTGMSPDHITVVGVLVSFGAAWAIGAGALRGGLLLVILAAVPDMLDGALAKAQNSASQRGAFFDSVMDRVTDSVLLGGVAWYLISGDHPHEAILPVAIMGVSSLISYERAKAESLGLTAKGGLMERAERIIVLCFGLLFDSILVPVLWVMLVLTLVTAVQRFFKVWAQAEVSGIVQARRDKRQVRRVSRQSSRANRRSLSVNARQRRRSRNG